MISGLLKLGWIADFFPLPVVTGVLAGIGVEILVKQLPTVLGLKGGGTTTIGRVKEVIDQISNTNGWAVGIAVGVLAIVVVAEKVNHRLPGALFGVVGATVLVAAAGLTHHGVHVVGTVKAAAPSIGLPSVDLGKLGQLIATAVTVAFLCIVQTSATVRSSQPSAGQPDSGQPDSSQPDSGQPDSIKAGGNKPAKASTAPADEAEPPAKPGDFDIDLIAVGAGSLLAGLAGSFSVNASPPRTAVVGSAGGKSQVSSLVAVGAILVVVAFATSLLKDLPEAALGAILIFVASRLFKNP